MKKRFFKNWKSSLVGVGLLAMATIALFMKVITLGEFGMFMPTVMGFIYVKDSIWKPNEE